MRHATALGCALLVTAWAAEGSAFCGFYIREDSESLKNDATQVVLMRQGRTTVMSLQNNYEGPPEDFALVIPVPTVLQRSAVQTLPHELFDRVDRLAAPRLVEYWEQNPCPSPSDGGGSLRSRGGGGSIGLGNLGTIGYGAGSARPRPVVRVEAEFAVDEYDVQILGADESVGLERWLRAQGYHLPRGASEALRPYVAAGSRFLVARVDASRLRFEGGRAQLSPLRIQLESDTLTLPIRLGMLNADGPQDVVVHVLAPTRMEVANRPNVRIPTNLRVRPAVAPQFGTFYAALFDATLREQPDAVVTEYAWSPESCDPCPGPTLSPNDLALLGGDAAMSLGAPITPAPQLAIGGRLSSFGEPEADDEGARLWVRARLRRALVGVDRCLQRAASGGAVPPRGAMQAHMGIVLGPGSEPLVELVGAPSAVARRCVVESVSRSLRGASFDGLTSVRLPLNATWSVPPRSMPPMTLTRMHMRFRPEDRAEDLVFREAGPLSGGRGQPGPNGEVSARSGFQAPGQSFFQARYFILHPWSGAAVCAEPQRGQWGPPPNGVRPSVRAIEDVGEVRRRRFSLFRAILSPTPSVVERPRPDRRGKALGPKPS